MQTLRTLFRTYQSVILSSLLILFCIGAVLFAVLPAVSTVQDILSEVGDLSEQTATLQRKLDTLTSLDETTLRNQLTNVLSAVPADRSFPTLFETVEGVAAQTGVSVSELAIAGGASLATSSAAKLSEAERKLGTRTIPFSVTVNGTLSGVQQFISLVPNVRRLLRIRVFSMSFPKELKPLTVVVEMDAFYEPLPTTLGAAKTTLATLSQSDEALIQRLSEFPLISGASAALPPPLIGKVKENPFAP